MAPSSGKQRLLSFRTAVGRERRCHCARCRSNMPSASAPHVSSNTRVNPAPARPAPCHRLMPWLAQDPRNTVAWHHPIDRYWTRSLPYSSSHSTSELASLLSQTTERRSGTVLTSSIGGTADAFAGVGALPDASWQGEKVGRAQVQAVHGNSRKWQSRELERKFKTLMLERAVLSHGSSLGNRRRSQASQMKLRIDTK